MAHNITVADLVKNVTEIPQKTSYWFVRTDNGSYFDTFVNNEFIAVGWNEITLEELAQSNLNVSLRNKIKILEDLNDSDPRTKGTITRIINKMKNFIALKEGDIIIIPSRYSGRFAFGIIQSSHIYEDIYKSHNCDFVKRKKVKWVAIKNSRELDPNFFKMRFSRHTISKVDDYSVFIDNVINSLYIKNDNAHFVLEIKTTKEINVRSLLNLIDNIHSLIEDINSYYGLNEQIDKNSIRLNLQSPGLIEFKLPVGKSLVILATILSLTCCSTPSTLNNTTDLDQFIETKIDTITVISQSMDELEVDKDRINSFAYGN